jgi:outer membrane protein assembly factor BamA
MDPLVIDTQQAKLPCRRWLTYLALLMVFFIPSDAFTQDSISTESCPQKDMSDVFRKWFNKPPREKAVVGNSLLLVPSVSSNPATGFAFGVAGQYAFKGNAPGDLYSSINGSANYTTQNQFLFQVKNNIFLKKNRLFLSGDWRLFIFSQATYGLGTSAPQGGALAYQFNLNGWEYDDDSLVQPMKFNHYRFHQTIAWKVRGAFYMGFGYHFDLMDRIVDLKLDTLRPLFTSNYLYSKKFGFNPERYLVSGLSFQATYDSRDNLVNPYKGIFASFNWRLNSKFLGSKFDANMLSLEWRSYHSLSKTVPRHLIGFWFMGNFTQNGKIPYLILPALAYDQRGRAGRGYTQGRFRGPSMIYAESEYRFPLGNCNGLFGGVLFANITSTNNPNLGEKLFSTIAPGYGFGMRLKVDKHSRTNLMVDVGFGKRSSGIYFGASETF